MREPVSMKKKYKVAAYTLNLYFIHPLKEEEPNPIRTIDLTPDEYEELKKSEFAFIRKQDEIHNKGYLKTKGRYKKGLDILCENKEVI